MKKLAIGIKNCLIHDTCLIVEPVNLYGCELGEKTFVGPFVEIQNDVKIGRNVRVQSHSFICSGVSIGDHSFIGHGVMFINDLFQNGGPARGNTDFYKETVIGENVSIGSNATILPVRITSNVVIGAGSVVTKDILEPGVYAGNPVRKLKK